MELVKESDDSNSISPTETSLTSEQQQSLIEHWNDAMALYEHTKAKLISTANMSRYNKLKQQMSQHNEHIEDYLNSVKRREQQRQSQRLHYSEWNYLNICIQQLLKLNSENVSYHLLAIQVYQSHPDESLTNKYLEAAIASCDIGVNLCLLHLNGHHQSFYVWITTFFVLKAQILFQQRKWKQVIQCILPSLKYQQSDNIHLLYNLRASAYCEMKQFREAIAGIL